MKEASPIIAKNVDRLFKACAKLKRDDIFPHTHIEKILGIARHTGLWCLYVKKLKTRMERERGITIWVRERGVGYTLLSVAETLSYVPDARTRYSRTHIRLGKTSVASIDEGDLGERERFLRNQLVDAADATQRQIRRQRRLQAALLKPAESRPNPNEDAA